MSSISLFKSQADGKFGTLKGVYIPNVLQMIGVILFMRLGWILGNVGIGTMSAIISLSTTIILLTSLSMTAIVTNMQMKGGGAYYLISRSLGIELGSAIGILQCISQLCSISLCVTGFSLSISELLPEIPLPIIKASTLSLLILISYFSTDFALKTQIFIFIALISAISGIFWGWKGIPNNLPLLPTTSSLSFWVAFSMFFPATTGIESGMSMSGDLRNPARSLPIGTIASVLSVFFIYMGLALFLSQQAPLEYLRAYPFLLYYANQFGPLIFVGVWTATLSSALGAILGGPRVIQAIARDGILPRFLAKGFGPTNQPRVATLFVFTFGMILTLFTDINQIIPIMTMSCLVSYGMINFIAFMEGFMKNPSWRPSFRAPAFISLIGSLSCFSMMLLINSAATLIVLLLVTGLCFWTSSRKIKGNWSDIRYSIYSYFLHKGMAKLSGVEKSPRNWRPHLLVLFDTPTIQKNLAFFAHAINQEKGFLTFGGSLKDHSQDLKAHLRLHLNEFQIPSHVHINTHPEPVEAAEQMVKNYGFGSIKPNTVLLQIPSTFNSSELVRLLFSIHAQKKNIILLKDDPTKDYIYSNPAKQQKRINLWWRGKYPGNFEFSLAIAFLLQQSKLWPASKIKINMLVKDEAKKAQYLNQFEKYRSQLRIKNLEFNPILCLEGDFFKVLLETTHIGELTFLGLKRPNSTTKIEEYTDYYEKLLESTKGISNLAYILSGEPVKFRKIFL